MLRRAFPAACVLALVLCIFLAHHVLAAPPQDPALTVHITSPLCRTGITGATRIVARVAAPPGVVLSAVQFFVDGQLVGEDKDGAPYAVDWTDDNPFVPREIAVAVSDTAGHVARDSVLLV